MGKHKKRLRAEKAKVKLRNSLLPKGGNVTNTSFKAKKIVIVEQLKSPGANELVSSKNLTVKELLSHLQHYNLTKRLSGLAGFEELIKSQPKELLGHKLSPVLTGVVSLVLDNEQTARRAAVSVIKQIFEHLKQDKMLTLVTPCSDVLIKHLSCAMTHINSLIQEDSLLLLDSLLEFVPQAVIININVILNNLLNKTSSNKSKTNILVHIYQILQLIYSDDEINVLKQGMISSYDEMKPLNVYISEYDYDKIDFEAKTHPSFLNNLSTFKENVTSCMSLFFNTWLEVCPDSNYKSVIENSLDQNSVVVLSFLLNTMKLFWSQADKFDQINRTNEMKTWFMKKYKDNLSKIVCGLPYTVNKSTLTNKSTSDDLQITNSNLTLCYFYHVFNMERDGTVVQSYVTKCLKTLQPVFKDKLFEVLEVILLNEKQQNINKPLLLTILKMYKQIQADTILKQNLLHLLTTIAMKNNLVLFHEELLMKHWLENIFVEICSNEINNNNNNIISKLQMLCVRCPSVKNGMEKNIKDVLINFTKFNVDNCDELIFCKNICNFLVYSSKETVMDVVQCGLFNKLPDVITAGLRDVLLYRYSDIKL